MVYNISNNFNSRQLKYPSSLLSIHMNEEVGKKDGLRQALRLIRDTADGGKLVKYLQKPFNVVLIYIFCHLQSGFSSNKMWLFY